ncbi:hypothetical protein V5799_030804 [Amblyomma americanum]|uniref:Secreted protein n=1 Tax=Amblyomma americanum TaxID=6943 RepID=A0AAQ4EMJ3_AMBAM
MKALMFLFVILLLGHSQFADCCTHNTPPIRQPGQPACVGQPCGISTCDAPCKCKSCNANIPGYCNV